jgi:hypothetical protein
MPDNRSFQWARAVEINQIALTRIVAEIFAMLGLVSGGRLERVSQTLYTSVERLLRPTESALRRLIVIAARGLVVKPLAKRPMPQNHKKGLKIARKASGPMAFRLFDTRKRFDFIQPENPYVVKVKTYTSNPFNLLAHYARQYPAKQDGRVNALSLGRRFAAVKLALENLPQQALRMARWKARRKMMEKPKFTAPLRPGPAPGQRKTPTLDVDFILLECQGLAWDSQREDSS